MLFIFSTPELIRHLWQLKTIVFLYWHLICAVLLYRNIPFYCPNAEGPKASIILDKYMLQMLMF